MSGTDGDAPSGTGAVRPGRPAQAAGAAAQAARPGTERRPASLRPGVGAGVSASVGGEGLGQPVLPLGGAVVALASGRMPEWWRLGAGPARERRPVDPVY